MPRRRPPGAAPPSPRGVVLHASALWNAGETRPPSRRRRRLRHLRVATVATALTALATPTPVLAAAALAAAQEAAALAADQVDRPPPPSAPPPSTLGATMGGHHLQRLSGEIDAFNLSHVSTCGETLQPNVF